MIRPTGLVPGYYFRVNRSDLKLSDQRPIHDSTKCLSILIDARRRCGKMLEEGIFSSDFKPKNLKSKVENWVAMLTCLVRLELNGDVKEESDKAVKKRVQLRLPYLYVSVRDDVKIPCFELLKNKASDVSIIRQLK